jgi:hypothetical protein
MFQRFPNFGCIHGTVVLIHCRWPWAVRPKYINSDVTNMNTPVVHLQKIPLFTGLFLYHDTAISYYLDVLILGLAASVVSK